MTKCKAPFVTPLREDWAESLLQIQSQVHARGLSSVYGRLVDARDELGKAVIEAAGILAANSLASAVASAAAKEQGKRGDASLQVRDDGIVLLQVAHKVRQGEDRSWSSMLPTLGALRQRAAKVGVDPVPYGRSKIKLLEAVEAADALDKRPRKRIKTAPAVGPVTQVDPGTLPYGDVDVIPRNPLQQAREEVENGEEIDLDSILNK